MTKFSRAVFFLALALMFGLPAAAETQTATMPTGPSVTSPAAGQAGSTTGQQPKRRRHRRHRRKLA
jgi:hypothetical protein